MVSRIEKSFNGVIAYFPENLIIMLSKDVGRITLDIGKASILRSGDKIQVGPEKLLAEVIGFKHDENTHEVNVSVRRL